MDLRALFHNFSRAKLFCRTPIDVIKYLGWLYGKALLQGYKGHLNLGFKFGPPIGELTLSVRANGGSDAFIFSEVFEHRYYDFDLPSPPATVLDLGANIGLTTLFFSRKYPDAKLACVEPMPGNVALLRTNLERNAKNVTIIPKAVSVEDKPLLMQIASNDYGHKVSDIAYGRVMDGDTLRVEGVSVPTLLAELGWARIGLLKVDVEGYEGVLLSERCEWLERVDALCIECHEGYGDDDLRSVAKRFGFAAPQNLPGTVLLVREAVQATTP